MLYIAICDDDEKIVKTFESKVIMFLKKNNIVAEIKTYTQSKLLQYDIQEGKFFDLVLCDIEMPDIDGMRLSAYIRRHLPNTLIILITSHLKYAIDAFELSIFRYIPKNSLDIRLEHALKDAVNMIQLQADQYYTIKMPSRIEKIQYHRILYIQREGKNAVIVLMDGTSTKVRKSLSQVYNELNSKDFLYVDRGDIVNLSHIVRIKEGIVELEGGIRIPASHAKLEYIKERLNDFWGEQI
ncbi:MAG: LytTR family DNA-binding domain-containing protein [Lachnospiraceae bacterium]